jgi:hypothetical protein
MTKTVALEKKLSEISVGISVTVDDERTVKELAEEVSDLAEYLVKRREAIRTRGISIGPNGEND